MKKLLLLSACVLLSVCVFMVQSCKKVYHATLPTPTNFRLLGYTKITTRNIIAPITPTAVVTETYSFSYDGNNHLSQVMYATNDSNEKKTNMLDLKMVYSYDGGNVTRTVTNLQAANVVEQDTFVLNGYNQLISSAFPFETHAFTYQGLLVANQTDTYRDSGTIVSATSYFTSDNHDLLTQYFNGTLSATFPDSGIRPDVSPIDTTRDSILSYPLTVTWSTLVPTTMSLDTAFTQHTVNSATDQLTGYSQSLELLNAVDANGIYVRPVYFPAGLNSTKFFQVYDQLANRTGDYLQLEAFKTYGVNIYQSQHLIKQLSTPYDTTFVTYDIDAQSKITETHVLVRDKLGNTTQMEYKLLYDTN